METVTSQEEMFSNIGRLGQYLYQQAGIEAEFARDLVCNGICFVITEYQGKPLFSPSRFIGYRNNTRHAHLHNERMTGRETTAAISELLGRPRSNEMLEVEYEKFCTALGIEFRAKAPFNCKRKYWDLRFGRHEIGHE